MEQGLVTCLLVMLAVRVLGHTAFAYQTANKQVTAADAAKTFALEWRMEATAHVASLMVRDQQCKGDPSSCDLQEGASDAIGTLSKWAVADQGWERLLSSVSLYAIARHAYQEAEYDEAIIALEESLALRLFAYADQKTLDRWQQGLVMPGSLFRRQKMDLANTLVLRSDCLVQLAREQRDVDDLTEAMELLQLATALLKGGDELVPDSVQAISRRAATIASVAVELLPQLKTSRIKEVLEHHGISCSGCSSKGDFLVRLVPFLRLPVRVASATGSSSSKLAGNSLPVIEAVPDPFNSHATALLKKQQEHVAQYMQRVFFRLLTLVPADYLAELDVACRRTDAKRRCISYLPVWVTAQAITIDKRTGLAHVSGPGACAGDGPDLGEDPSLDTSLQHAKHGSCISGGNAQLNSEPFFVPGDAAGSGGMHLPDVEPHNPAGIELCGFMHIRGIPPGVALPTSGGSLTQQEQRALKDKAVEGVVSGQAQDTPFKGMLYYFYADIPALIDRIINTFEFEEGDFLFEQLKNLTAAKSLHLADRISVPQTKGCSEQVLLDGKALPTCNVLVPNLGSCAKALTPRRRVRMDPVPAKLGLPPPVGSYTPRLRARVPPETAYGSQGVDGSNDSGDRERLGGTDGSSDGSAGQGGSRPGRHHRGHHHHHGHFPLTDRELSDRQLQEQLAKLARDAGRRDRDDPLVPLTLAGCAVASFGLYLASKRRRRSGSSSSSSSGSSNCGSSTAARLVLLGLGAGRLKQASSSSSGSGLGIVGTCSSGVSLLPGGPLGGTGGSGEGPGEDSIADAEDSWDGGAPGSRQKRMVAAALRIAMNSTDTGKLEAALVEAEAADLQEAGLLQRARVLLDKRKKKDQLKAAAEKTRLKALKKEEAKRGRKAAAKREAAAAAAVAANCAAPAGGSGQQQHCSRPSEAGDDISSDSSKHDGRSAAPGPLQRLLQLFGLGGAFADATVATSAVSNVPSRASSGSLSRASSSFAGLPGAAAEAGAAAAGPSPERATAAAGVAKDAYKKQQQQSSGSSGKPGLSGTNSRSSSMSDISTAGSKGTGITAAAAGNASRAVSSHPISTEPSGSSVDDMYSTNDTAASPESPATASSAPGAAPAAHKSSSSRRKGKGLTGSSSLQQNTTPAKASSRSSKTSAFDNPHNSMKSPLDIAAEIAAAAEARAEMLAQQALEKAAKQQKASKQAAAASQAAAPPTACNAAAASAKQLQQQKQRGQGGSTGSLTAGGVTAPVTPPAVATPAAGTAARAAAVAAGSGAYGTPTAMHSVSQQQQQQQQQGSSAAGALPSVWASRQAAISDDGSSSTCSNTSKLTAASTPNKPKLNPKAVPYQPVPVMTQAAKATISAATAQQQQQQQHGGMFGYGSNAAGSPASDWRNISGPGALGISPGAFSAGGAAACMMPLRGPSPVGGAGGWISDASSAAGLMLGGGNGGYHLHQQFGPADAAMDVGSGGLHHHGGSSLVSYRSADQGVGSGNVTFDQGMTSPNHHQGNMDLMAAAAAAALSPHQQYNMHQQQQLLELLSAAGPGEARYGRIGSAGGSAPVNLGHHSGSMNAYIAAHAAAAHNQRSSYSSVPDHHYSAVQGGAAAAAAAAGGAFPPATGSGRGIPPGFSSAVLGAQQKHQQQRYSRSGGLALNIDDDQLPPGFSAEDYTTATPSSSTNASVPCSQEPYAPATTMGMAVAAAGTPTTLPSPSSIPTTAPLFAGGSSVWAPLAATAGTAASSVAASMRALWPSPLTATSAAEHVHHHDTFGNHGYSRSQDLEVEVAAAATSANVAEHVLGSSPSMQVAGAADAQMSKLAKEIAMELLDGCVG